MITAFSHSLGHERTVERIRRHRRSAPFSTAAAESDRRADIVELELTLVPTDSLTLSSWAPAMAAHDHDPATVTPATAPPATAPPKPAAPRVLHPSMSLRRQSLTEWR
jgi:hypothetical protein